MTIGRLEGKKRFCLKRAETIARLYKEWDDELDRASAFVCVCVREYRDV